MAHVLKMLNIKSKPLRKQAGHFHNRGSAAVEASIVVPILLFFLMFFVHICNLYAVRSVIYEASAETAGYMAEYAYLTDTFPTAEAADYPMAYLKLYEYLDDSVLPDRYVMGGLAGISLIGSEFKSDDGYVTLKVSYIVRIDVPLLRCFAVPCTEHIRQRAYIGRGSDDGDSEEDDSDEYVYVAENGTVYHTTRSCTYLSPRVYTSTAEAAVSEGYRQCRYCRGYISEGVVYVTESGECYHSTASCSRIKRTVSRRKKSEVSLPACSKCGGG